MQKNLRGQASVEYLFVIVFLVGFIVAAVIPAVKEAELSLALASARSAAVSFQNENKGYVVTTLNYSIDQDTAVLAPRVYLRADGSQQPVPPALKSKILAALKESIARETNSTCALAANYAYCLA